MISFYLKYTKVTIHFSFLAVLTLFLLTDPSEIALYSIAASLFHEAGHLIVMLWRGIFPEEISFEISGIRLHKNLSCLPFGWEAAMLLAGSSSNFFFFLWEAFRTGGFFLSSFGTAHLFLGILNLLPFSSLDGGKLLALGLGKLFSYAAAHRILTVLQGILVLFLLFFCVLCFLQRQGNFTLMILCGYSVLSLAAEIADES